MDFTRRLPGVRVTRHDEARGGVDAFGGLLPGGWLVAYVFIALFAVLDIFLFCHMSFGDTYADFWNAPRALGLSMLQISHLVNAAVLVYVVAQLWSGGLGRRGTRGARWAVYGLAVVLLGLQQYLLFRWGEVAEFLRGGG